MNTAKKIYRSDEHGVVHLDVPVGALGQSFEMLVVWMDAEAAPAPEEAPPEGVLPEEDWSDVVGVLQGVDDFRRHPQGEHEKRSAFG